MPEAPESVCADERRLAAFLAADVAGSSRLMRRNDEETVRDLEVHRSSCRLSPATSARSSMSQATALSRSSRAVRAVECSVTVHQKIMAERRSAREAERAIP
jgi:hypothetical protein